MHPLKSGNPAEGNTSAGSVFHDPLSHIVAAYQRNPQPLSTFVAFDEAVVNSVGRLFLTVFRLTPDRMSERIFTSDPNAFPIGNLKPLPQGGRAAALYREKKPFFAFGLEAIQSEYDGHAKVIALGAEAMANFPILLAGDMIGAVNIGGRGWESAEELEATVGVLVGALAPIVALMPFPSSNG